MNIDIEELEQKHTFCADCPYLEGYGDCGRKDGECKAYSLYTECKRQLTKLNAEFVAGTAVKVKCERGSYVYSIRYGTVRQLRVIRIHITQDGTLYRTVGGGEALGCYGTITEDEFGDTVFLTEKEAEARLKELQEV